MNGYAMDSECGFQYKEHTADITIECWAPSLEEAFEVAAFATFETMLDVSTIEPKNAIEVECEGIDLEELLVEWIGELIALVDINEEFYSEFDIKHIERKDGKYSLKAVVKGETVNLEKHDARTGIKAMTYADMVIDERENKFFLRFTLDL